MSIKFDITPIEIKHKEFKGSLFGFSKKEVQEYLQLISAQMEDLIAQKDNGHEKANIFDDRAQSALLNEQLQKKEELISRTLMQAENTKNEILRNANQEAENIVRSAELAAKKAIDDTKQYINSLKHHYETTTEIKRQFLMETHAQATTFVKRIEQDPLMDKSKESEMDSGFAQASHINLEQQDDK